VFGSRPAKKALQGPRFKTLAKPVVPADLRRIPNP
jgi:hypothetical protein